MEKAALALLALVREHAELLPVVGSIIRRLLLEAPARSWRGNDQWLEDVVYTSSELPGWELRTVSAGNSEPECPHEVRFGGVLFAQSWDLRDWAVGRYVETGTNLSLGAA